MKVDWDNGRSKFSTFLIACDIAFMCYFGVQGNWFLSMIMFVFTVNQFERLYLRDRLPQEVLDKSRVAIERWEAE